MSVVIDKLLGKPLLHDHTGKYDSRYGFKTTITVGTENADYITDGTADDVQLQTAIDALETAGGGTLVIKEGSYTFSTGLVVTLMNLSKPMSIYAYGAVLNYTGTGDALLINTNIDTGDDQKGERTLHTYGLHIKGTGSASCGIRNFGGTRCSFKDTTLENFTSVTEGEAALILDSRFNYWIEENHYDGLEIINAGNGIAFISRNDVDSVAASCMNNTFTALSIWITQDNGKGMYGVGEGASGLVQIARCVFNSVIVHPKDVATCIAFDLTNCYCSGTVFNAAGVDTSGTNTGITAFKYENSEILLLNGFTAFPTADIDNWLTGSGQYLVLAGNTGSTFRIDASGNIVAPTLTLLYDLYDANGNSWIKQEATANAVNRIKVGNAATGGDPYVTPDGTDENIDLQIYGKGTGKVYIDGVLVARERELFVEARYTSGNYTNYGSHSPKALANGESVYFQFTIPYGMTSILSCDVIGVADATETIQYDIDAYMAADGEAFGTHQGTITDATKSTTANVIWFADIKSSLTSAATGDLVGIKFTSNTDYLYITGLRFRFS